MNETLVNVAQFQAFFLTFTRIMATIIHVPVLAGRSIPNPIKIGLGLILAIFMTPLNFVGFGRTGMDLLSFSVAIGKEILIGTLTGYAANLAFGALSIAGNLIGLGSGFAAAQILNPALEEQGTPLDQILVVTSFLIFLAINGHHSFLLGLQRTFEVLPINSNLPDVAQEPVLKLTASLIQVGVQMSFPLLATLLLTDLAMGLLARVAPQIQVFFLGIPLKIGLGIFALAISIPALSPLIRTIFGNIAPQMLVLLGK
ncbi:MAG: Flagellar biosynthesis protein FliR [Anaerolineae bacterium]|nr:MAG: Flagellar biosynthesis protein FliR [Anaerolineae bacterium]